MTDPNAPNSGNDDSHTPPLDSDEHGSRKGQGRKTNVQRPPEDQRQNPDPRDGEAPHSPRQL